MPTVGEGKFAPYPYMNEQGLPALPAMRCRKLALGVAEARADAPFWREIEPVSLSEVVTGNPAKQRTRVRTAWDGVEWRVLFEVEDTYPWATFTSRGLPLWEEEVVEVFFDPVGDLESYFEVEINPLGMVKDLVLRRSSSGWKKNFAWTVEDLQSCVRRTAEGWAAELSIPFESLGSLQPAAGSVWRVNFLRIDRPAGPGTDADLSAWSPTGLRQFHRAERFGSVEFTA